MCRTQFSTREYRFPEGYDHDKDDEDDGGRGDNDEDDFPEDWLEILMVAANPEEAQRSSETGSMDVESDGGWRPPNASDAANSLSGWVEVPH